MSSRAYDLRSQIKTRLVAEVDDLDATQIIIDREHDIMGAIETTVATATNGIALTIQPMRGVVGDPDSQQLIIDVSLVLSLWTRPIIAGALTEQPEEAIHEAIMQALHHFTLTVHDAYGRAAFQKLKVLRFDEVDDAEYLRRDTIIISEFSIL